MKRTIFILFTITMLGMSSTAVANSPPTSANPSQTQIMPVAVIDNVEVPYDICMNVQMDYPGHAVTHATAFTQDGKQMYRLRIDTDGSPEDNIGIYLLFDNNWNLVSEEKSIPQPKHEGKKPDKDEVKEIEEAIEDLQEALESEEVISEVNTEDRPADTNPTSEDAGTLNPPAETTPRNPRN